MGLLEILIVVFLVLWITGNLAFQAVGSVIHVLLVVAVVLLIIRLLQGRKVL